MATVPPPSRELEARILQKTVPETAMGCEEFEECLTDYLDGFLPAHLYHRWERHAALCDRCTELPGEVVRAIGACYTYISEERPLPEGLERKNSASNSGNSDAAGNQSSVGSARGFAIPFVAGPDHLAAACDSRHDVAGGDPCAHEHCFCGWFDWWCLRCRVANEPDSRDQSLSLNEPDTNAPDGSAEGSDKSHNNR